MKPKSFYVWITLALILYLFFSLTWLGLPGLYYDETNFVNAALGATSGSFVSWSAEVFGKKVPLMIMDYIGALKSALYAPIFKIFGCSAVTARAPVVLIGLITLLAAFGLFRRMFDGTIAVVALLLFATDCSFIFANRLDWGPVSLMLALGMSALYCMWRWMQEENRCWLALAGLLFGLGLYNKVIFIWIIAAFFVALLLCYRTHVLKLLHWRSLLSFIPAFLFGCLPLIVYNIEVPLGTFQHQSALTVPGIDDVRYRFLLARGTLDGSGVYYLVNYNEVSRPSTMMQSPPSGRLDKAISAIAAVRWVHRSLLPYYFAGSLALIALLWIAGRLRKKREILFLAVQFVAIAAFICLNEKATGAHHLIAFYPFLFILIAFAVCELGRWISSARLPNRIFIGACLLPLLAVNSVTDARYLKSFQAKGGHGGWSDAIYRLGDFVRENPDRKYILMEWGFTTQLILLTHGRLRYEDFACSEENPAACMDRVIPSRNANFVFHVPQFTDKPMLPVFKEALARQNLQGRRLKTFFQRDGRPIYVVYEVTPPASPAAAGDAGFSYMHEGEDFDRKSGGDLDAKEAASGKKALGNFWGRRPEDFVTYKFTLSTNLADARLSIRYAFEDKAPHAYFLLLDGNYIDTVTLPPTPGYGYTADQWKTFEVKLGPMEIGGHELKIVPAGPHQILNLDFWSLSDTGNREDAKDAKKTQRI
jgi:4-amino-4-deoxy-L-arabinose transferase-like glycosyltransferase